MTLIEYLSRLCYNSTERKPEDISMSEEKKYSYGFLYKKSKLPNIYINSLLNEEEFVNELDSVLARGKGIEDDDIYQIVKKMYIHKYKNGEKSANARVLYKVTRKLSILLCDDENAWEEEFIKILTNEDDMHRYLLEKSKLPSKNLLYMLQFDDFVQKINKAMGEGKEISDIDIYNITAELCFPMLKKYKEKGFRESYENEFGVEECEKWLYKYDLIKRSARAFSKALYGDFSKYKSDYQEYLDKQ